jgi:CoA-dependent NAD(P)H sulfur oxidoreductase
VNDLSTGTVSDQEYEKLLIATGARAIRPEMPTDHLAGIFFMKQFQDGLDIRKFIESEKPRRAVIIGGGYIGLEASEMFGQLGLDVTLVEARPRIMEIMDEDMSEIIVDEMRNRSVQVLTGRKVIGFEGTGRVEKVLLDNGDPLDADCVLVCIGVTPNSEIAGQAGLARGEKNAVMVDRYLRTNDPDIYAAGDCSTVYHRVLDKDVYIPLALGANRQGRMCGENIAAELSGNELKPFPGVLGTAVTKFFDCEVGKSGIGEAEVGRYGLGKIGSVKIKADNLPGYYPGASDIWVKLYYEDASRIVVGGQIIGRGGAALRINTIVAAISARMSLADVYNLDTAYAPPFSPVWDPILIAARVGMK